MKLIWAGLVVVVAACGQGANVQRSLASRSAAPGGAAGTAAVGMEGRGGGGGGGSSVGTGGDVGMVAAAGAGGTAGGPSGGRGGEEGGEGARSGGAPLRAFVLPPAPKVMFLGDSITLGNGYDSGGGYRGFLLLALPSLDPIGTSTQNPLTGLGLVGKDHHEGFGGQTSTGLAAMLPGFLQAVGAPDVVLFHIGVNESYIGASIAAGTQKIYDLLTAANPNVVFLMANPMINPASTVNQLPLWEAANAAVAAKLATLPRAVPVAMPFLSDAELLDAYHPVAAGYARMASAWEQALRQLGAR